MKNPLHQFVSALGLALGAMRSSKSHQTPMSVTVETPYLDALISSTQARRGLWPSPFNRQEYRQGRRFRSQKERSNRRKASR